MRIAIVGRQHIELMGIELPETIQRPILAGNAMARIQSNDAIKGLGIRSTATDPATRGGASAPIDPTLTAGDAGRSRLIGRALVKLNRPESTVACITVSGDLGFCAAKKSHALLEPLADLLGGALSAPCVAVEAGYAPDDYQVGQTAEIVAPPFCVALGVPGASQHLATMTDSRVIAAIKKDAEVPMYQVADYGLGADFLSPYPSLSRRCRGCGLVVACAEVLS